MSGKKILWYPANKDAENYILKEHPELESVMMEKPIPSLFGANKYKKWGQGYVSLSLFLYINLPG